MFMKIKGNGGQYRDYSSTVRVLLKFSDAI